MLKAKYKDTNKVLNILDHENPRMSIKKESLVCRLCEEPLGIRQGLIRTKHFYHLSPCSSDYKSHPESPEHLLGKELISKHIKEYWQEYSDATIELEYILPEIKRVADIALIFPNGWVVVHEIQLSSITTENLIQRTKDYESIGIDTFWWLGHRADSKTNQDWCIKKYGYSLSIEYEALQSRLKELLKGKKI
jgi:competence CoiA-like predicted nuclease